MIAIGAGITELLMGVERSAVAGIPSLRGIPAMRGVDFTPGMGAVDFTPGMGAVDFTPSMSGDYQQLGQDADFGDAQQLGDSREARPNLPSGSRATTTAWGTSPSMVKETSTSPTPGITPFVG